MVAVTVAWLGYMVASLISHQYPSPYMWVIPGATFAALTNNLKLVDAVNKIFGDGEK